MTKLLMKSGAELSACKKYRYSLWRIWGNTANPKCVMFIGLNPSTADEYEDDPTIRRCIAFAKAWGYDGLYMVNLFAYRATNPNDMKLAENPVGSDNDLSILKIASKVELAVACWGNLGKYKQRDEAVRELVNNLQALKITKLNQPSHPLYLSKSLKPTPLVSN
jgi:hypothetical protein